MLWKCCTQYVSKFGKCTSGHRTGKGQFSFQTQRKAMPKNAQTTTHLHRTVPNHLPASRSHSFHSNAEECPNHHTIALISHASKVMLKILQAKLQQYGNWELPDVQAQTRRGRRTKDQIANICWIMEKARVSEKHLFLPYWLCQSLWLWGSQYTVENSESDGNTRPLTLPLEKSVCRSGSNSQNWTWNSRLVPNRKRSTSRLYIVTLLI